MLEWNNHGDFVRLGEFCRCSSVRKRPYRILGVDYYREAGAGELADCLNRDYRYIIVDYGEITGQGILDCARCDRKVIVGSLSEWQAEGFLETVKDGKMRDKSWRYAAAFGSEETRKELEKHFQVRIHRIPFSQDVFAITRADIEFFSELLRN